MNTVIRSLYSPGFASMMLSFYRTNLAVAFTPWISKDKTGRDRYDTKKFVSTTINDESVASLYFLSKSILEGKQCNPLQYVIDCNNAKLIFEYRPDPNNKMRAYLSIEKDKITIPFEFAVQQYKIKENGRMIIKEVPAGLEVFSQVMAAYLTAVGADRWLNNQQDEYSNTQLGSSTWNGW